MARRRRFSALSVLGVALLVLMLVALGLYWLMVYLLAGEGGGPA